MRVSLTKINNLDLFRHALFGLLAATFAQLSAVQAAPPAQFGSWSANGAGKISAPCPSGFSCQGIVSDAGVFQQFLTDRNGRRFIQTVIMDSNADGQMLMEAYVDGTGTADGISAMQNIRVDGTDTLDSTVHLNMGWANTGQNTVVIDQMVTSSAMPGVGYMDQFHHEIDQDQNGNEVGYFQAIRQEVTNTYLAGGDGVNPTGRDIHVFESRKAAGTRTGGSGSASLPSSAGGMGGMGGGGGPTGGTMNWNAGDEIQAIYIGQICEGCQIMSGMMKASGGGGGGGGTTTTTTSTTTTTTSGGMTGGGGGTGGNVAFSYQSYDNLSDGSAAVATRDYLSTGVVNWNSVFGTAPATP